MNDLFTRTVFDILRTVDNETYRDYFADVDPDPDFLESVIIETVTECERN